MQNTPEQALLNLEYAEHNELMARAVRYLVPLQKEVERRERQLQTFRKLHTDFIDLVYSGKKLSYDNIEDYFARFNVYSIAPV